MRTLIAIWLPVTFSGGCLYAALSVSLIFMILTVLGLADTRSRYIEFKRFRSKGKTGKQFLMAMKSSACQRYVAIASSQDMKKTSSFYRSIGYRWWCILPDGSSSLKDNIYFKRSFYVKLFGI